MTFEPPIADPAADDDAVSVGVIERIRRKIRTALPEGSVRLQFASGAFWSVLGTGVSSALVWVAFVIAARVLQEVGFGQFGMIRSTVGMFGVLAGMGLSLTGTRHVAELRSSDPIRAGRIVGLCLTTAVVSAGVIAIAAFAAAPYLARTVMNEPSLTFELRLGCGLLFFNALNGAQVGALSGLEAFKALAISNTARGLVTLPLVIISVYLGGLRGLVLGMVLATFITCIFMQVQLHMECRKSGIPVTYRHIRKEARTLWRFSLPAVVSSMLFTPAEWIMAAMLVHQPAGYAELGVFNAGQQFYMMVLFLPDMVSRVSLPVLSRLWGEKRRAQYRRVLLGNYVIMLAIVIPVIIPVAIFSRSVMGVYGSGFSSGMWVLVIICIRCVISAPNIVVGQAIWSTGAAKAGMIFAGVRSAIVLGLFALFVSWGALGMAASFTLGDFLIMIAAMVYMIFKVRSLGKA